MEGKNSQKSISEQIIFEIPAEYYEKDMGTDLSKEKKHEILDLLKSYNKLKSKEEFDEIKSHLHYACRKGDLDLIKILLSDTATNDSKDLVFKIDTTNKTASLFKVNQALYHIIVPRIVNHKLNDYLVTSIASLGCTFDLHSNIKTIKFEECSEVKTFYGHSFSFSTVEEIHFPNSLNELKEGWCSNTSFLKRIVISSSNNKFIFKDDKYLLCKSNVNNKEEFDILQFASRDIKEIFIPSNVTKICDNAFSYCLDLKKIQISTTSKLQTIGKNAFSYSKIEEIYFPGSLNELEEGWCSDTKFLKKIVISPSNDNFVFNFDKYLLCKSNVNNNEEFDILLFANRDIKEIFIPPNVTKIGDYAFSDCEKLNKVKIPTDSKLQTIGKNAFSRSKIKYIFIPSSVTKICESAFEKCSYLKQIKFPTTSRLQKIEKNLFNQSNIKKIRIPPSVIKICENAFYSCYDLRKVHIPNNSNLQIIEKNAFSYSKIEEIYFPSSLNELEEGWCSNTRFLKKIVISPSNDKFILKDDKYLLCKSNVNNNEEFDILLFASRDIEEIFIPPNVTKIYDYTFSKCEKLNKVKIPTDSKLQTIERFAFLSLKIEEIFIPASVTKICERAFANCDRLRRVRISTNSNLQTIEQFAFSKSSIISFYVPSSVSDISDSAFFGCDSLQIIEFPEDSKIQCIIKKAFLSCHNLILMIPPSLSKVVI